MAGEHGVAHSAAHGGALAAHVLLLTSYCLLFNTGYLLLATYFLLFATHCPPLTSYCSPLTITSDAGASTHQLCRHGMGYGHGARRRRGESEHPRHARGAPTGRDRRGGASLGPYLLAPARPIVEGARKVLQGLSDVAMVVTGLAVWFVNGACAHA